LSVLSGKSQ